MRRYFYQANPFIKRVLEKQLNAVQHEENLFRAAMLASIHNRPKEPPENLYEEIIERTMQEQMALAQANHLQQLFRHFDGLHKAARGIDVLYEQSRYQREGIIDPDKFPISEMHEVKKKWLSGWPSVASKLKQQLGFILKVKPSSLQHIDSGRGVYIDGKVPAGTFLGFVPGHFYQDFKKFSQHPDRLRLKQYLHFPTDCIIDLARVNCWPCEHELDGSFRNPYALGEIVNHPAPRTSANICFQQIVIPKGFFPSYHLNYLPVERPTDSRKLTSIPAVGMFSLRELRPNEELFVNCMEHHVYHIDAIPEWLVQPPPSSVYLSKDQYEHVQWDFWTIMQNYALKHNRELYEKYRNTVRYEPDRYEFERNGKIYRKLNLVKFEDPR